MVERRAACQSVRAAQQRVDRRREVLRIRAAADAPVLQLSERDAVEVGATEHGRVDVHLRHVVHHQAEPQALAVAQHVTERSRLTCAQESTDDGEGRAAAAAVAAAERALGDRGEAESAG